MHPKRRLLTLFLLIGTLFIAACSRDPQVQKQKFYNKGLDYLKKGKVSEAKLQFLNALKIDASFAEAATALAEIQYREKNFKQAYTLLQQAVHARPDLPPAHKGLAQIYRSSGNYAESQRELELVLERTPNDIETLINLGTIQALQHQPKDAEGTWNRVLELQPGHAGALIALAQMSRENNDLPSAERFLKLALDKNPHSVPVYLTLLKLYLSSGRSKEVESLFQQALNDTGNNVQILEAQDGFYEGSNRLPEAEAVVTKIQSLHASEPAYWGALAGFYVRTNNWAKAKSELERKLQQHKDDVNDLHALIEVNLNMDNRREAESLNRELLKKNPGDSYAHVLKGRMALADDNIDQALAEFSSTRQTRPDWPALHFWTAQAYLRRGQIPEAQQELQAALTYDPDYRMARLTLAGIQNRSGAPDAAMANVVRVLKINSRDVPALLVYSESLIYKKNYDQAEKTLRVAAEIAGNFADVHRQLGILHLAKKNMAAARKEFRIAWELHPNSEQFLRTVVDGYLLESQAASGMEFLQQAIAARPDDAKLRIELARMYWLHGQREEAVSALRTAMKLEPGNPEGDIMLADVYSMENKTADALSLLVAATHKPAAASDMLVRAGMIYERLQHWDEARDAYEQSLRRDASNATAKNNLASVLADHGGDLSRALTLAKQAKDAMGDRPEVTATLGWIYYKQQIYPTALKYLQDCAQKDQKNATFQYQLGMTQWKLGNNQEARRLLTKSLQLDSHFPEAASANSTLSQLGPL